MKELTKDTEGELVFVTAFLDFAEFRKHIDAIAWETEVWMADRPTTVIDFSGLSHRNPRPLPRRGLIQPSVEADETDIR